ncbi:MAG: hypothetical protein IPK17_08315 [Chloroflexi bacterium]|uniref:hypothetical protein n=1 Tax=Candidatus Flexifilum breve TaxID=3140694 RepID=UPI00313758C5|nr:hypothetical protein [Chloroflexota bacterium]
MTPELKRALKLADRHTQTQQYAEALAVLRPFQDHPAVATRIKVLKQKRDQRTRRQSARGRKTLLVTVILAGLAVELAVAAFILGRETARPAITLPTLASNNDFQPVSTLANTGEATVAVASPVPTIASPVPNIASPVPTAVVENPAESSLQDAILQQLLELPQTRQVFLIDVDESPDGAPIVYLEMKLQPGMLNETTLDAVVTVLDEALGFPTYSNLEVILSDDESVVDFIFDSQTGTWSQTVLSGSGIATAAP